MRLAERGSLEEERQKLAKERAAMCEDLSQVRLTLVHLVCCVLDVVAISMSMSADRRQVLSICGDYRIQLKEVVPCCRTACTQRRSGRSSRRRP